MLKQGLSLRDKRLFEISEVEVTGVDCSMKTNRSGLDLHLGLSFLIRIVFKNIYNDLCKHCFSANLGQQYYTEYAKKKKNKKKKRKKKKKKKKNGMV